MGSLAGKTVILIRHGESLGQAARKNGIDRKSDESLIDCGLTRKGQTQAYELAQNSQLDNVDLVVVSPLTRALVTALCAFKKRPDIPIICHAGARERGSTLRPIPENRGRPFNIVRKDLARSGLDIDRVDMSLIPDRWPNHVVEEGKNTGSEYDRLLQWIHARKERNICIVTHHNAITLLLGGAFQRIPNAAPIECECYTGDTLRMKQQNKAMNEYKHKEEQKKKGRRKR